MAELYRGHQFADASNNEVAVYERGTFKGRFPSYDDARAFVDASQEVQP